MTWRLITKDTPGLQVKGPPKDQVLSQSVIKAILEF